MNLPRKSGGGTKGNEPLILQHYYEESNMSDKGTKRVHRQYDEQYKREAVKLAESSKKPLSQVARELGIHDNNLRKWVVRYGTPVETAQGSLTLEDSLRENARLRRELAERSEEVEILKKAATWFAMQTKG